MISYEKKNKVESANVSKKPIADKNDASKIKGLAVKTDELPLVNPKPEKNKQ